MRARVKMVPTSWSFLLVTSVLRLQFDLVVHQLEEVRSRHLRIADHGVQAKPHHLPQQRLPNLSLATPLSLYGTA